LAAALVVRFLRTGGPAMLRAMGGPKVAGRAIDPTVYTCPMHAEIRQDEPGRCPICGMDLVPASAEGSGEQHRHHDPGH
jgi:Heavy metal binding domain